MDDAQISHSGLLSCKIISLIRILRNFFTLLHRRFWWRGGDPWFCPTHMSTSRKFASWPCKVTVFLRQVRFTPAKTWKDVLHSQENCKRECISVASVITFARSESDFAWPDLGDFSSSHAWSSPNIHDAVKLFTASFQSLFMACHDWFALLSLMLIESLKKLPLMHQTPCKKFRIESSNFL